MSARDDGGPAFPQHVLTPLAGGAGRWSQAGGMALRDFFAAQAMQGMCARISARGAEPEIAEVAYLIADAMLRERAK